MDKCRSVLLWGFILIVSPVLTQTIREQNLRIWSTQCQQAARTAFATVEAFQPICRGAPVATCCKYVAEYIDKYPTVGLCTQDGYYTFSPDCGPTPAANAAQHISVRTSDDSKIHFIDDPHDAPDAAYAEQKKSTPSSNRLNVSDQRPVLASDGQNRVPVSQQRPASNGQSLSSQQGPTQHTFNFGDNPQYNVQVAVAPQGSNGFNQRVTQPPRVTPRPNGGSNYQPNVDDDDEDYEDERVPIETGSVGYQATEFALNLFKNLERSANSDSLISPLLPQLLLSNLVDYASPVAQAQLRRTIVLHPSQLAMITNKLDRISKSTVNTIETASANFVAEDVKLNRTYASDISTRNVEVRRVDFGQPHLAARNANNWVSGKTHNLINEILSPSAINPSTRLLLANTIYFKGTWKYTFIESNPGLFEPAPNNPQQRTKMFQLNKLRYGEVKFQDGNGLRWVELPYEGNNLAMLVFLPKVRHQLDASMRQLKPYDLARVLADLQSSYINTKVHLTMPKFTLFDSVSLIPALKRMGLHSIFQDPDALQYITNESMVVSDVTQRSFMSVDEFGTKATSVASLSIITLSITPQYRDVKFDVDQPFVAMIVDKEGRYPFFIGQINDPKE